LNRFAMMCRIKPVKQAKTPPNQSNGRSLAEITELKSIGIKEAVKLKGRRLNHHLRTIFHLIN